MLNDAHNQLLKQKREQQRVHSLFEQFEGAFSYFDEKDIAILIKFYITGRPFPSDTQPYCFPELIRELRNMDITIGNEAIRKRMKVIVRCNLLTQDRIGKNTTSYYPLRDDSAVIIVRRYIEKWCAKKGLGKVFNLSDNKK